MIVKRTSREEIMKKLRNKVDQKQPIFIASAGSGLVAQLLEKAGVDCINTFSGARLRANGMGTMSMLWPILDSNKQTLDYTEQDIMPAIEGDAFICACVNANDPLRDMYTVIEHLKSIGVFSTSVISRAGSVRVEIAQMTSSQLRVSMSSSTTMTNFVYMNCRRNDQTPIITRLA